MRFFLPRSRAPWMPSGLATRKLSVRLSNVWIVTKRKKVMSRFFIPYERSFSLVLWEEEWLVGRPLLPEILGQTDPVGAYFQSIFARSASAVAPSNDVQLTLIGNPLRAFQWAEDEHRTLFLSSPKGGGAQKRKTAVFELKSHFAWRKSATKFLCVKTLLSAAKL